MLVVVVVVVLLVELVCCGDGDCVGDEWTAVALRAYAGERTLIRPAHHHQISSCNPPQLESPTAANLAAGLSTLAGKDKIPNRQRVGGDYWIGSA